MQPSVLSSLAAGQWALFKWQRFLMAQGQGGAWCKVGESGGSSESLLRQWQRFLVRFSFVTGSAEGCSVPVFLSIAGRSGRWLWQSTDTCHTLELRVGVWAAGTFGRWEGACSASLPCSAASGDLQLCLWMLWWEQSQVLWHPWQSSGYPVPALRQSCTCDETWGQVLHLLLMSCRRLRICSLPGAV